MNKLLRSKLVKKIGNAGKPVVLYRGLPKLLQTLKNSDLLLTLPSKTAQRMAKNYNFSISELPLELETRQTKIIWHKELTKHPAFDWMKEKLTI